MLAMTGNTITLTEAREAHERWVEARPQVREYNERQIRLGRHLGYVETILGRRRYLPELRSTDDGLRRAAERMAINMPITGTSADLTKLALRQVWELLGDKRNDLVNVVHDEIDLDTALPEAQVRAILQAGMVDYPTPILKLGVPIRIEVGFGNNWAEAH